MTTKEFLGVIFGEPLPSKKEILGVLAIIAVLYFGGLVLWAIFC